MYESYFGLGQNPFSPTPTPEFIYESQEYREALAHFRYAIDNREAFLLLTGEVGTGKTTAVQSLRRDLPPHAPVAVVTHTTLEPHELLEEIALRFGLEPIHGESKPALMHRMETFLRDRHRGGNPALLILDEAHLLHSRLLEEVRLLSNLEGEDGKLLQICLVGQPELESHLQQPEMRQIRQRISVRYAIRPLSQAETREYILHRLSAAGAVNAASLFSGEAATAVYQLTQGIPREINVLAGQALLNAFLDDSRRVERAHAISAKSDYGFEGIVSGPSYSQAAEPSRPKPAPPVPQKLPTGPRPVEPQRPTARRSAPPDEGEAQVSAAGGPSGPVRRPIPLPPRSLRPVPPAPRAEPDPTPGREQVSLSAGPGSRGSATYTASDQGGGGPSRMASILIAGAVIVVLALLAMQQWDNLGALVRGTGSTPAGDTTAEPQPLQDGQGAADPPQTGGSPNAAGATGEATPPVETAQATPVAAVPPPSVVREPAVSPPSGAPTTGGSLAIQVASFRTRERAEVVLKEVTERTGLPGVIESSEVNGEEWQRILLGSFTSPEEAETAAEPLIRARIIRSVVVRSIPEAFRSVLSRP